MAGAVVVMAGTPAADADAVGVCGVGGCRLPRFHEAPWQRRQGGHTGPTVLPPLHPWQRNLT